MGPHLLPQGGEQVVLQGDHPVAGGEDGVLQVLQLLGDEPLAVGQGLLADVVGGDLVVVGAADLDVVAEDLVVAHLQALDAGLLPLPGLHLGDDPLAPRENLPEPVHLAVVAVPDEAPLPDGEGRVVHDGLAQQLVHVLELV